jgi:Bacterial Ig domain
MKQLLFILTLLFVAVLGNAQVQYSLQADPDGVTYNVFMKSAIAYTLPMAQVSTAQVTVIVPTGTAANQFSVTNLTSYQNQMSWSQNARANAPTENPTKDYISFGFQGSSQFIIPANTEIKLFSFKNGSTCLGAMELIVNATDPFNVLPNSKGTNPGNAITILGKRGDSYASNYGSAVNLCGAAVTTYPPTANSDNVSATTGITTNIAILANDKNPDGTIATLTQVTAPTIVAAPTKGLATVKADGSIDYLPNAGATGTDTITYKICNVTDPTKCSTTTITVNITAPPVGCPTPNCGTATIVKN